MNYEGMKKLIEAIQPQISGQVPDDVAYILVLHDESNDGTHDSKTVVATSFHPDNLVHNLRAAAAEVEMANEGKATTSEVHRVPRPEKV